MNNELFKTALNKAMRLCSEREYCIKDIREKASAWGLGSEESQKIIKVLVEEKFIDEDRYTTAFVKDKFNYNKWGRLKITAGLRMKGIPQETIHRALASIDNEKYRQMLENLLAVHRKKIKARNQYDLKGKLMRYGLSKGFESSLLYEILGEDN